jgi:hypothetical protein
VVVHGLDLLPELHGVLPLNFHFHGQILGVMDAHALGSLVVAEIKTAVRIFLLDLPQLFQIIIQLFDRLVLNIFLVFEGNIFIQGLRAWRLENTRLRDNIFGTYSLFFIRQATQLLL